MNNLKAITERAGGKSRFWFASLEAMNAESVLLQPVWHVAQRLETQSLLENTHP